MPASTTTASPAGSQLVGEPVSVEVRVIIMTLGWLIYLIGVAGNILIIITLFTQRALRSPYNMYIGNLALVDLAVVAYFMPFWLLDFALGHHPVVNLHHCVANGFLSIWCVHASIYTLVLISFNRYLSVCHPNVYARWFNKNRIIVSCIGVWIVCALEALIPVFHIDNSSYAYSEKIHLCTFDGTSNPMNIFVYISVINYVVPTILVGFFSFAIFRFWKKSKARINQWAQNQSHAPKPQSSLSSANMALIRSLVLVFLLLLLFYLPLSIAVAIMGSVNVSADVFSAFGLLFSLNSSINWVVYGAMNKSFRMGYKQLLTKGCLSSDSLKRTNTLATIQ